MLKQSDATVFFFLEDIFKRKIKKMVIKYELPGSNLNFL
jgi:hypothetical protein